MHDVELNLATVMGGVIVERLNDELMNVLMNVVDPNTSPIARREVNLKITFKPEPDRSMGKIDVLVTSKLAPAEKIGTHLFISMTKAGPVATEFNPNQLVLPEHGQQGSAAVVQLHSKGGSQ